MKVLGRNVSMRSIPKKALEFAHMAFNSRQFRKPNQIWSSYLTGRLPSADAFELRSGEKIYLSDNPHDPITVMVIFCRKEYGIIRAGDVVVDIGANIGAFSIHAARSGAKKVISVEPNRAAHKVLQRNIQANGYNSVIEAINRAIAAKTGDRVFLPISSSPYNKSATKAEADFEEAETISLDDLVERIGSIDLLKIDCEGAEYEVFLNCRSETLHSIRNIRMELHPVKGFSKSDVINRLEGNGLKMIKQANMIYWFER